MALYLTPADVAARWACSTRHVERLCASGALRAMRLGTKGWRIPASALEEYERRQTNASASGPSTESPRAEPIRPVFGVLEEASAPLPLPERWWEGETASPRTRRTKQERVGG